MTSRSALCGLLLLAACASFSPPVEIDKSFLQRSEVRRSGDVTVSAVVLSDDEADRVFGARLSRKDIQPIWLEIENRGEDALLLMLLGIDPAYFSASEAAWRSRRLWERRSREKMAYFAERHVPLLVPAEGKVAGYAFTNRDPGAKAFEVQLIGDHQSYRFDFVQLVPGLRVDFERERPEAPAGFETPDLSLDELRAFLFDLPCCVLGGDRETPGDPLNIAIVGDDALVLAAFVRRGWDLTETLTLGSAWQTVASSLFGSVYRTSPISPLHLFGRSQDVALQKARGNVDERNHLRLWQAPVTHEGAPVWVGQISRDIGVKLTSRTLVTHRIDPDVDEARTYLMLDLLSAAVTRRLGFVGGVGVSEAEAPRVTYTRDPYLTDGLRLVMILGEEPTPVDAVEWLDWEWSDMDYEGMASPDVPVRR